MCLLVVFAGRQSMVIGNNNYCYYVIAGFCVRFFSWQLWKCTEHDLYFSTSVFKVLLKFQDIAVEYTHREFYNFGFNFFTHYLLLSKRINIPNSNLWYYDVIGYNRGGMDSKPSPPLIMPTPPGSKRPYH